MRLSRLEMMTVTCEWAILLQRWAAACTPKCMMAEPSAALANSWAAILSRFGQRIWNSELVPRTHFRTPPAAQAAYDPPLDLFDAAVTF